MTRFPIAPIPSEQRHYSVRDLGPVNTAQFLHKERREKPSFRGNFHTDPHKNTTKSEIFENAIESGYSQKRRLLKNDAMPNDELHKTGAM